jgi:HPt (histidine-containing phosphotransfer) domain-containing protein
MAESLSNPEPDLSFLYEIADGSDDFIVESIDMFSQQTPPMLADIGQGISDQNWVLVGSAAHKLKPNLGFFGMHTLQQAMGDIEHLAKGGVPDTAVINKMYIEAKGMIEENLVRLQVIKAEKLG